MCMNKIAWLTLMIDISLSTLEAWISTTRLHVEMHTQASSLPWRRDWLHCKSSETTIHTMKLLLASLMKRLRVSKLLLQTSSYWINEQKKNIFFFLDYYYFAFSKNISDENFSNWNENFTMVELPSFPLFSGKMVMEIWEPLRSCRNFINNRRNPIYCDNIKMK